MSSLPAVVNVRQAAVGLLGSSLVLLSACTSMRAVTSGQIGCPEDEITISDDSAVIGAPGAQTWTAECRGRQFYCSAHSESGYSTSQVTCTEAMGTTGGDSAPTAATAPAEDAAEKACGALYKHAAKFAPYWVSQSDGGVGLASLPEERDFRAVCTTISENIRRCMFEGYRVLHKDSCEAMLTRIDAPTRSKIDSLFLAAAAAPSPPPAPSASSDPFSPRR